MDEQLIIEIWDTFKEYIPQKNLDNAATHFVDFLVDHDVSSGTLESLQGMDGHLDDAIKNVLQDDDYDDEEEELDFNDEDY